ncbi:endolytic transglycosylase MltG [Cellulomonas sp. P22]|uniref:endolytic transglycosylase MltG n=1 Tax=Cellulomonas sp. P22 TaxID=3373189 RepID=UPI0037BE5985
MRGTDAPPTRARRRAESDEHQGEPVAAPSRAAQPGGPDEHPVAPRRRSRREVKAQRSLQRRHRRRRKVMVTLMIVGLLLGAGYVVYSIVGPAPGGSAHDASPAVADHSGPGIGEATVTIAADDTPETIAQKLVDGGVVATVAAFTDVYVVSEGSATIEPGTYKLRLEMSAADALAALLDPANRVSLKVTIDAGQTASQIFEKIGGVLGIPVEQLTAAAADPAAIGLPAEAGGNVEGWLAADAYQIDADASATAILQTMVAKTVETLTANGVPEDSWQTVLIKSSLVQAEGTTPENRAQVARAIDNRLARANRLEIDAVLAYGLGKPVAEITSDDRLLDHPYNTSKNVGLPPTPIGSPSAESIAAVLNPASGTWIFWTVVDPETGEMAFSDTLAEHNANLERLREWEDGHL